MTREEAARTLEVATVLLDSIPEADWYVIAASEACKIGAEAIRELDAKEKQKPLTIDELRQMDGEPVWCASMLKDKSEWAILRVVETRKGWYIGLSGAECAYGGKESYEETWLAYRNKPKEEHHAE